VQNRGLTLNHNRKKTKKIIFCKSTWNEASFKLFYFRLLLQLVRSKAVVEDNFIRFAGLPIDTDY